MTMPLRTRNALLAASLIVVGQADVWTHLGPGPYHGSRPMNAALALIAGAAVAWRRRAPLAAQLVVVLAAGVSRAVFAHDTSFFEGFLPLVVLTANAAYMRRGATPVTALLLAELALVTVTLSEPRLRSVGTFVGDSLFLVLPWLAASVLRRRSELAESLAGDLRRVQAREAEVIAEERARIARELHDVVAHSVSVMVVNAGAARLTLGEQEGVARDSLLVVERAGRQALAELRRLLGVLRTDVAANGGHAAPMPSLDQLSVLLEELRASGLSVELERTGAVSPLPAGLEVSAYRIVQEALTNVVRHAGRDARTAVRLHYGTDALDIEVVDDGGSVRPHVTLPSSGHGLVGARERSALFGGWADAGPLPGRGWRLQAHLPFPREAGEVEA